MRTLLYMAMTVNGYISDADDGTSWISPETWTRYQEFLKGVKVAIIGRRTYELMSDEDFSKDRTYYVLSHKKPTVKEKPGVIYTKKSPGDLIKELQSKKIDEVWILGGGELNASFLAHDLIDELFIDLEPQLLSQGTQLFDGFEYKKELKLLEANQITEHTIQLHYAVNNRDSF